MTINDFEEKFLSHLNSQQKEAVHTINGAVLLLAVPGSGKTTVLVNRLGYMICCKKIDPSGILTMTYTVAATNEMKQRFCSMFGADVGNQMEFCTINSLSSQIIRYYSSTYSKDKPFELADNATEAGLIGRICQEVNEEYPTESTIKDVRTGITYIKNMMLTGDAVNDVDVGVKNLPAIYKRYRSYLRQMRLMDYDDQLAYAYTVLKNYPQILESFQKRFPYLCVDESQDTSKIQHEIIRLLAGKTGNLFMVGDEDQSIYGFRAAYPQALLNFKKNYPGAKILLMEENYRSTEQIVSAANVFVSRNRFRYDKKLKAVRGPGEPIEIIRVVERTDQYKYLFEVAKSCSSETAILYRNNDSALPLIDILERNHIPYNCKKFENAFFTNRIVADLTDIIHFASQPRNTDIFLRIYYKIGCRINKIAAHRACERSIQTGKTILEVLKQDPELSSYSGEQLRMLERCLSRIPEVSAEDTLLSLWQDVRYCDYAELNNLDAGKLDILRILARNEKTAKDLLRRLDELKAIVQNHRNSTEYNLTLSTVHSSKGLEYETVYLLDVCDGILPYLPRSEIRKETDFSHYEEERRIFYVAMTRARDQLYLFSCKDRKSEFVEEIQRSMPIEKRDKEDLFDQFREDLRGKTFSHCRKGKGRIIAQCGDRFLIEYKPYCTELSDLRQLAENRDKTRAYLPRTAIQLNTPPDEIQVQYAIRDLTDGSRVTHRSFGNGTIISITDGVAEIRFDKEKETKRLMLDMCLRKGLLKQIPI